MIGVLAVCSEIYPLIKTGGLADVTGALPAALAGEGIEVRTLIPGYPAVTGALERARTVRAEADLFGGPARLLSGRAGGLDLLVLDAPHLYARPGNPYQGPDGRDWPDNAVRFAALAWVAADIGGGALEEFVPEILHSHDWQAGLTAAYSHYRDGVRPRTVMTVHNLAFTGQVPASLLAELRLPPHAYSIEGVEFYGSIGMLKSGLWFADRITTVSPAYAAEIRTPEAGMGFDGLLRTRADVLTGILNGIDTAIWDPASDPLIVHRYDTPTKRSANKAALQARMGLAQDDRAPLFGVVSRLTWQKGMDLLLECLPVLRSLGAQLALVGSGDSGIETAFRAQAAATPDQIACITGYDEGLAHMVQAGADALLVPSRFEPCGLTQLCALRYGAVPVVARVGGLADTVIDANLAAQVAGVATGVQFAPVTADMLEVALHRTVALYREPSRWHTLQENGMATDVSWRGPGSRYAALFRELVAGEA
jgi:starch synthase